MSQKIVVRPSIGYDRERFSANGPVQRRCCGRRTRKVVLHGLLHDRLLSDASQGHDNLDVLKFYERAKQSDFHPPDAHVPKNVQEFPWVARDLPQWISERGEELNRWQG